MSQSVKAEETPTPAATTAATPAPTQQPAYSWAIDPALQAQPAPTQAGQTVYHQYPAYSHYYPYQSQYTATPQTAQTTTTPAPVVAQTSTSAPAQSAAIDTSDINTLRDALGSTGVDLRAEEESLQRTSDSHLSYRSYEDRTRKQPPKPNFNTVFLTNTILQITTAHKLPSHPSADTVNYLALALRARLQDLVTDMITAAHHRTDTQFDRPPSVYEDGSPMWSILVRSDVAKQLSALEKVEREEETRIRRERKERADLAAATAAALAAQSSAVNGGSANLDDDLDGFGGGSKKKRKKDGPGVTAKNMSADVQKKMSNAAASHAAGLSGRYAWMTSAASSSAPKKPAAATSSSTTAGPTASGFTTTSAASTSIPGTTATLATAGSSWARPYVPTAKKVEEAPQEPVEEDTRTTITMRDAMFVIQKERGHGGGRGAAKGWT
ncbi:hypothetical protein GYMLUDRAFT_41433 [Collybiopsis luxurians FD-317 M1]|uniref:Transcription initiation factor TFIID subunit 4 n=1 Tax=Collybiopsis luxurians FD-317 M1 TaxID=944289 RepID=A0A0D0CJV3_9AGAR|nr:hypothetical protein GYMLUDRAFT_41433 [Collybiopsis luxurians FD-317 M1]